MNIFQNKKNLLGNKKGNAFLDTITFVIVFFAFAVFLLLGKVVSDDITADMISDTEMFNNQSRQVAIENNENYAPLFDNLFIFAFALFWIFVLVASYNIKTMPLFFVISIILLLFVFIMAAVLTNTWEELVEEQTFADVVDDFPKINFISSNWLSVSIVIGFSILFMLYAKR